MSVRDLPHFEVESSDFATWLDVQGPGCWWSVDGDLRLMGEVSFPCPSDVLADKFRQFDEPLLVLDPLTRPESRGTTVDNLALDALAHPDETTGDRLFLLSWKRAESAADWLLSEDKQTAELSRELIETEGPGNAL